MGFLSPFGFLCINGRLRGHKGRTMYGIDICSGFFLRYGGDVRGIRTHISDQTDRPLFPDGKPFVKLLCDHHRFLR